MDRRTFLTTTAAAATATIATPSLSLTSHPRQPIVDYFASQPTTNILAELGTGRFGLCCNYNDIHDGREIISGDELAQRLEDIPVGTSDINPYDTDQLRLRLNQECSSIASRTLRAQSNHASIGQQEVVLFYAGFFAHDRPVGRVGENRYVLSQSKNRPFTDWFGRVVSDLPQHEIEQVARGPFKRPNHFMTIV